MGVDSRKHWVPQMHSSINNVKCTVCEGVGVGGLGLGVAHYVHIYNIIYNIIMPHVALYSQ